ncbi:MAG: hypothetical protein M1820_008419 [Bogoriella megaspora]|nr:MAG: hypothetical protein M1820_008419 [Bogoriella megaspora]
MADAEADKAEKLAAAKKRFEQLKKQKAKKGASASKKKEEKAEADPTILEDVKGDDATLVDASGAISPGVTADNEVAKDAEESDQLTSEPTTPGLERGSSASAKSRMRSESFRQGSSTAVPQAKSAGGNVDPETEVQDIYRKQAQRIEELEKENRRLQDEAKDASKKIGEREEELEELREGSGEARMLKDRAEEIDKMRSEINSLQRQNTQLQSQISKNRRVSAASPSLSSELEAQIASKTSTIESLELELSSLRSQLSNTTASLTAKDAELTDLRSQISTLETSASETTSQIQSLQSQLSANATSPSTSSTNTLSTSEAESRITLLTSQLSTSQLSASNAQTRIAALEKKAQTLTTLHKEAEARHQSRIDALATENAKLKRDATSRIHHHHHHTTTGAGGGNGGDDDDDDDAAIDALENESRADLDKRIRELEAENFELRRGVWRERRAELQPGMGDAEDTTNQGFDDVDLGGVGGFLGRRASRTGASPYRTTSTFSDVLNSGLSAFTGGSSYRGKRGETPGLGNVASGGGGKEGDGLLEDDEFEAFDEEAFARAQEEEARKRVERVREVKKGLEGWRGWRVDLVDLRGGVGAGCFDI